MLVININEAHFGPKRFEDELLLFMTISSNKNSLKGNYNG